MLIDNGFEFNLFSLRYTQLLFCLGQFSLACSQFNPLSLFTLKIFFTELQKLPLDFQRYLAFVIYLKQRSLFYGRQTIFGTPEFLARFVEFAGIVFSSIGQSRLK